MRYSYSARKVELKDSIKERAEKKLQKLDKFFDTDTEAKIVFSDAGNGLYSFEVSIIYRGIIYRTKQYEENIFKAIDKSVDQLVRQIVKNKARLEKKLRAGAFEKSKSVADKGNDYELVKVKRFAVKPMDIDEAILKLNMIGHDFFIFRNENDENINVVYRRQDGNYGLIIPN